MGRFRVMVMPVIRQVWSKVLHNSPVGPRSIVRIESNVDWGGISEFQHIISLHSQIIITSFLGLVNWNSSENILNLEKFWICAFGSSQTKLNCDCRIVGSHYGPTNISFLFYTCRETKIPIQNDGVTLESQTYGSKDKMKKVLMFLFPTLNVFPFQ